MPWMLTQMQIEGDFEASLTFEAFCHVPLVCLYVATQDLFLA